MSCLYHIILVFICWYLLGLQPKALAGLRTPAARQLLIISRAWDETPMTLGWGVLGTTMSNWLLKRLKRGSARGKLTDAAVSKIATNAKQAKQSVVSIMAQRATVRWSCGPALQTQRQQVVCWPAALERTTADCLYSALDGAIPQLSTTALVKLCPYVEHLVLILAKDAAASNTKLTVNLAKSLPETVLLLSAGSLESTPVKVGGSSALSSIASGGAAF